MKKKIKGFSLIELLVVVAILGVIAAIGLVSYDGYVSSTKRKSAENMMRQIGLGQSEYYSLNGNYYGSTGACIPSSKSSSDVQDALLEGAKTIVDKTSISTSGYFICVQTDSTAKYKIIAQVADDISGTAQSGECKLEVDGLGSLSKTNC